MNYRQNGHFVISFYSRFTIHVLNLRITTLRSSFEIYVTAGLILNTLQLSTVKWLKISTGSEWSSDVGLYTRSKKKDQRASTYLLVATALLHSMAALVADTLRKHLKIELKVRLVDKQIKPHSVGRFTRTKTPSQIAPAVNQNIL